MKLYFLLLEMLDEESEASKKAKQMGLDYMRFGRWGKNGVVTHKSEKGRLVPTTGPDDVGLRPGKTFKSKNKLYKPGSSTAQAKVLQTGPNKGKIRRLVPKLSPTRNRLKNLPQDELEPTVASVWKQGGDVERRLAKKLISTIEKKNLEGRYTQDELLKQLSINPQYAKTVLTFIDKYMGYDDIDYPGINREDDGTYTVNPS